tara:strand:+ start:42647 stop:42793 length:147 start_codon:yes stop_codon:yes gene_type:complete
MKRIVLFPLPSGERGERTQEKVRWTFSSSNARLGGEAAEVGRVRGPSG